MDLVVRYLSIQGMSLICLKTIYSILIQKNSEIEELLKSRMDEWIEQVDYLTTNGSPEETNFAELVYNLSFE